jgi:hypothetical protein
MRQVRTLAGRLLIGLTVLWILLLVYPVRTEYFRTAIPLGFLGILACFAIILWRHRVWRWIPVAFPAALVLFLLLPGRPVDRAALRTAYVNQLQSYEGVRYVWGGENWLGVDCSGLVRAALVDAHFHEAIRTFNPALARQGLWFWWHDSSARGMSDGYQGRVTRVAAAIPLQDLPPDLLIPGDIAVTADGSHVLASLGAGRWIEADPYTLRVIELGPNVESGWWRMKALPCRWLCLDVPQAAP